MENMDLFSKLLAKFTDKDVNNLQTALHLTEGRQIVRGNHINKHPLLSIHPTNIKVLDVWDEPQTRTFRLETVRPS
jgi:hypothetical protein